MKYHEQKILFVSMQWDYGKKERGVSGDKLWFFDNLRHMVDKIEPFWYDDYLGKLGELQELLLAKADEVNPDLIIFMLYTDQFTMGTLDVLKEKYRTYAWFGDDQWRFESYTTKMATHFTYVSTTDPWSIEKYRRLGIEPILTQWGAQQYAGDIGPLKNGEAYEYDVTFIGGRNAYRSWFINELTKLGFSIQCFGAGWSNGRIGFEDMQQVFRKSKINLNISNSIGPDTKFVLSNMKNILRYYHAKKNAEQIKARNFEIPLAGGFQLSNYVLGLERYLTIGEEVAVYTSVEECAKQVEYYLSNGAQREEIIRRSHERALNEHTYSIRLEGILDCIWDKS